METSSNVASENSHTDVSYSGTESKPFLTELKLIKHILFDPLNTQENTVKAILLPGCASTLPFSSKQVSNFIVFPFASLEEWNPVEYSFDDSIQNKHSWKYVPLELVNNVENKSNSGH